MVFAVRAEERGDEGDRRVAVDASDLVGGPNVEAETSCFVSTTSIEPVATRCGPSLAKTSI
jgi:hypothetical protein